MVIVSCSGKFHAFNLAEQLAKHKALIGFYTRYAYQRNTLMRQFVSRVDKEQIPTGCIHTIIPLAVAARLNLTSEYTNSHLYDQWVASQLRRQARSYEVFIGWSGMSLHSLRQAKRDGKLTIIDRGAAHIQVQDELLRDEYNRFGKQFCIDPRVVDKECQEYAEADYIAIPSQFVKRTFLERGVPEQKLLIDPYGTSSYFQNFTTPTVSEPNRKFTIIYLGSLTIQKGLLYLFQALQRLCIPLDEYHVWFVGHVAEELKETITQYQQANWTFWGHTNHYELPTILSQADIGVQPSIQDGFSMVVPQLLAVGVPVIVSQNNGAADVIQETVNGFIVPARSAEAIRERLQFVFDNPSKLAQMKMDASSQHADHSWEAYGERYMANINRALTATVGSV